MDSYGVNPLSELVWFVFHNVSWFLFPFKPQTFTFHLPIPSPDPNIVLERVLSGFYLDGSEATLDQSERALDRVRS